MIDSTRLRAVVAAIPKGRWATYGDVAAVCGGKHFRESISLNGRLTDLGGPPGAHRLLTAERRVSDAALGHPATVRARLEREGVVFDARDKADPETRLTRVQLEELLG